MFACDAQPLPLRVWDAHARSRLVRPIITLWLIHTKLALGPCENSRTEHTHTGIRLDREWTQGVLLAFVMTPRSHMALTVERHDSPSGNFLLTILQAFCIEYIVHNTLDFPTTSLFS
ncbi:unnamed protein product [Dibothriocephalus latus]|uniref:Uncharacterized protein n=1 Tax=Dibothriocephalus latus TaxID=60516 RepID=A0A3P7PDN3_DIBLA|nr:unnamed protein product [Dibothriocephalus latus]